MDVPSNLSHPLSNLSIPVSNLSLPDPTARLPLDLHHPLLTIIVVVCLFVLFGGCVIFLALGCSSGGSWGADGDGSAGDGLSCGPRLSSEPQLKLWKRLGSMRQSFSSAPAFRRPARPYAAQSRKESPPGESRRNEPHTYITIPSLLQYATEI